MVMKDLPGVDIKVIRQGIEKYLTLSLGKYLVFKDSLQFLGSSLATLAKNLERQDLCVSCTSARGSMGSRHQI